MNRNPPVVLQRLLAWVLPPGRVRDGLLGDLAELYAERAQRSRGRANLWYARQLLSATLHYPARRLHGRAAHQTERRMTEGLARHLRLVDQIRFSWLDVKLGLRMLRKHPALTIVAVFALAVAIPMGLVPLHLGKVLEASLPVPEGERIRAIRYWPVAGGGYGQLRDLSYYEFIEWRDELRSFSSLAAIDYATSSLSSSEGAAPPVSGARVTASTFDILRIQPLLGRPLVASDEVVGAPRVVVVGYDLWQSRLEGDPEVVGQTLRIAGLEHTVVGIMPEGFRFPEQQELWLPLRVASASEPADGPFLRVFGRLADDASVEQANAEIASMGRGMSAEFPDVREGLRAEVVPFGFTTPGILVPPGGVRGGPEFLGVQLVALVLLVVACANVALLIFARSITRFRELAIRTALGASRLRILSQMLVESLVLVLLATGVGLFAADELLSRISGLATSDFDFRFPYWLDLGLTWEAVLWGLVLALFSSVIAGVMPAIWITGRAVQQNIQQARVGQAGVRFGRLTTAVIVADLALALPIVGLAVVKTESLFETRFATTIGAQADQYLAVELQLPTGGMVDGNGEFSPASYRQRLAATERALVERLRREPEVRAVAAASVLPRMSYPGRPIELEDPSTVPERYLRGRYVYTSEARVGPGYFDAFEQPLLAGRGFLETDARGEASPVIVNAAFVDTYLGGRNAVGHRLRFETRPGADEPPPWREIVGVVGRPAFAGDGFHDGTSRIYLGKAPGEVHPLRLAIRLDVPPARFEPRVRDIVAEVSPAAALTTLGVLGEMVPRDWYLTLAIYAGLGFLILILFSLAVSGLYAVMSFAVAERRREIGIRTALGADRVRIAAAILRRAAWQVGLGALVGTPLMVWLFFLQNELIVSGTTADLVLGAMVPALGSVVMVAVLACSGPTVRALRVEPTEALRAEE